MARRSRVILLSLTACALVAPLAAQSLARARPELVGMSSARLARLSSAMHTLVDRGQVAGVVTLVARRGKIVELDTAGFLDLAERKPMRSATLFRIASMTKPVTSVAVMMLVEEGKVLLNDPVSNYIPAFTDLQIAVVTRADSSRPATVTLVPAKRPITVRDLLTHRSGLSYVFDDSSAVGDAYRKAGVLDGLAPTEGTLATNIERLAAQPLSFEPGSQWRYGLSTDVLGRLVEVVSGQPLDRFFRERIFVPLRMNDTYFYVPDEKLARLATPYTPQDGGLRPMAETEHFGYLVMGGKAWHGSKQYFSGGAGLFSTAGDYARFLQMVLNGGELDGARLLSPKTVELMTASATGDLAGNPLGPGRGFGLGFGVVTDLGLSGSLGSVGQYAWGGIYGSTFWVDPKEEMVGVMMIQLYPQRGVTIGTAFRTLAYQAITASYAGTARH